MRTRDSVMRSTGASRSASGRRWPVRRRPGGGAGVRQSLEQKVGLSPGDPTFRGVTPLRSATPGVDQDAEGTYAEHREAGWLGDGAGVDTDVVERKPVRIG